MLQKRILITTITITILLIGSITLGKSIYAPFTLAKPNLLLKSTDLTQIIFSNDCYITNSRESNTFTSSDFYDLKPSEYFNGKLDTKTTSRFSDEKSKLYWASINPHYMKLSLKDGESVDIRCFIGDIDGTQIPGSKFTKISNINGRVTIY